MSQDVGMIIDYDIDSNCLNLSAEMEIEPPAGLNYVYNVYNNNNTFKCSPLKRINQVR